MSPTLLTTQKNIFVQLSTPLGENALMLTKLEGVESISQPFMFELEMYAHNPQLNIHALVGKSVTVTLKTASGNRYITGVVGEISEGHAYTFQGQSKSDASTAATRYHAKIYPSFWTLKFDNDFAIFQNKNILSIVKDVLKTNKLSRISDRTNTCGRDEKVYCVRYDESAFTFVSRLLENAGIYYYHTFSAEAAELTLADSIQGYVLCEGGQSVSLVTDKVTTVPYGVIYACSFLEQITPIQAQLVDYDFEHPRTNLQVHKGDTSGQGGKVYQYPGGYTDRNKGEALVKTRLGALDQDALIMTGGSTVPGFSAGHKFNLKGHPNRAYNKAWALRKVYHLITIDPTTDECTYYNEFEAFPATIDYRPPQVTPRPKIYGAQTAIVTTKKDEEIWVDRYGRVKVKFHWDLDPTKNDKTTCWIRVAQGWAGKNWGMVFMPREGQEVVVSFLNGDPDQPLITGSVYNGDNMPPYLPNDPSISTIKTSTTKGGKGFNELRFNDQKDNEELYIHAQKDFNVDVGHTLTNFIHAGDAITTIKCGNRTVMIDGDTPPKKESGSHKEGGDGDSDYTNAGSTEALDTEKKELTAEQEAENAALEQFNLQFKEDGSLGAKGGKPKKQGNDILILKRGSRFINLESDEGSSDHSLKITNGNNVVAITKGDEVVHITEGDQKVLITKGNRTIEQAEGNERKVINGGVTHEVKKNYSLVIDGNLSIEVAGTISIKTGKSYSLAAATIISQKAETEISLTAGTAISVKAGEALSMESGTLAAIKAGSALNMEAGEEMGLKAGMVLSLKAAMEMKLDAGMGLTADAAAEMSLTAGAAFSATGGADASLTAGGMVSVTAGGVAALAGALVTIG